jgi:hypothetical protein
MLAWLGAAAHAVLIPIAMCLTALLLALTEWAADAVRARRAHRDTIARCAAGGCPICLAVVPAPWEDPVDGTTADLARIEAARRRDKNRSFGLRYSGGGPSLNYLIQAQRAAENPIPHRDPFDIVEVDYDELERRVALAALDASREGWTPEEIERDRHRRTALPYHKSRCPKCGCLMEAHADGSCMGAMPDSDPCVCWRPRS